MGARRRSTFLVVVLSLLAAAPAHAATSKPRTIRPGVTAAGVDVAGLTVTQAAQRLTEVLGDHLARDVVVGAAGKAFLLKPADAQLKLDAVLTAKRAVNVLSTQAPKDVPLALSHSKAAVRAWVGKTAAQVLRPAKSATVKLGVKRMTLTHAHAGKGLDQEAVATAIDQQLDDPLSPRVVHAKLVKVNPAVTVAGLRRTYGTVITVDRTTFTLRVFKGLRFSKSYGIAVGMAGLDTPAGTYHIQNKQVDPAWHVPMSDWAGSLAGKVIPGGAPDNPLKARWLGIANGVGIHGTAEEWSIGSRASHGCIRMRVADVKDLYPRIPVGTTVLIK